MQLFSGVELCKKRMGFGAVKWKGFGWNLKWIISIYYADIRFEKLKKITQNISQDIRRPNRDLDPAFPNINLNCYLLL
jgi:hypothetical protein